MLKLTPGLHPHVQKTHTPYPGRAKGHTRAPSPFLLKTRPPRSGVYSADLVRAVLIFSEHTSTDRFLLQHLRPPEPWLWLQPCSGASQKADQPRQGEPLLPATHEPWELGSRCSVPFLFCRVWPRVLATATQVCDGRSLELLVHIRRTSWQRWTGSEAGLDN